jgi:hypothetical protein
VAAFFLSSLLLTVRREGSFFEKGGKFSREESSRGRGVVVKEKEVYKRGVRFW